MSAICKGASTCSMGTWLRCNLMDRRDRFCFLSDNGLAEVHLHVSTCH